MNHPANTLSDVVHQRARLGILAVVHEADRAEFGFLQQTLELTSGNLSRHLQALEDARLIAIERGYHGKRARTWVRITKLGRQALADEIASLKELIKLVEQPRKADPPAPTQPLSPSPSPSQSASPSASPSSG
jgi:DNA-binding MarR family transcriptional regulator